LQLIRIAPAAASLAEQLMVVSISSHEVFFNVFMERPTQKYYPPKESDMLMVQLIGFSCFSSYMHLSRIRASSAAAATIEDILDFYIHHGFSSDMKATYLEHVSTFGHETMDHAKQGAVAKASRAIVAISPQYRKHRDDITFFVDGFWNRTADLVNEFFRP
jgi:hypothetical protein